MLSIHINLSAGAQNITCAYIISMLVYRRLLTTRLPGKQLCDSKQRTHENIVPLLLYHVQAC